MRDLHPLLRFVFFVILYFFSAFVLGAILPSLHLPFLLLAGLGNLLVAAAATGVMLLAERRSIGYVGMPLAPQSWKDLGAGFLAGCAMVTLLAIILLVCRQVTFKAQALRPVDWSYLLLILMFAAIGEELMFRGYGFQRLIEAFGPAASILILSVLFAVMHRNNPGASATGLANTVVVGILLALAYLRTKQLWLPIGIHWGWNLAEAAWGFPVSGIKIEGMPLVAVASGHPLLTGGDYGPEASLVGTFVIVAGIAGLLWSGVDRNHAA